jgi:hypothetical protein
MKTKKKPVVELGSEDIYIRFSMCVETYDESKHCVQIEGSIKRLNDFMEEEEVGILKLTQLNFGNALNEGEDWRDLIDLINDDLLRECEPLIDSNFSNSLSDDFEDMMADNDFYSAPTLMVLSKLGIYKEYRGNNLLGSILGMINSISPEAVMVTHPFPLQHNTENEENLKIVGIKSEKKTTLKTKLAALRSDEKKLIKHYEKHGFERLADSGTWIKFP